MCCQPFFSYTTKRFELSITLHRRKSFFTVIPCKGISSNSLSRPRDASARCSFLASSSGRIWLSTHCDQSQASLADAHWILLVANEGHILSLESFWLVRRQLSPLHELPEKKVYCFVDLGSQGPRTGRHAVMMPAAISTSVQPVVLVAE